MWHSMRKLTWHKNTKMSYLYFVVALTLLCLLAIKGNGSIASRAISREISHYLFLMFPFTSVTHYNGRGSSTHILSQLLLHSCQCLCSAPYTQNGYQLLDEEGSISQEVLSVSRCQKVSHDLYNKNSQ